ncbi:MAG: hypothetical protein KGZ83_17475 [Sulfuricella sp.]|nr:hypothetical protein [Sulfuricella sp.]
MAEKMTEEEKKVLMGRAVTLGVCFAIYKFVPSNFVKAMALGVAGVAVAKQVPMLRDGLV